MLPKNGHTKGKLDIMSRGLFNYHGLTLIPALISNYIHCNVSDDITYRFRNFNDAAIEVISTHIL